VKTACDECPSLGSLSDFNESRFFQHPKCFPHYGSAYVELLSQSLLTGKLVTDRKVVTHDFGNHHLNYLLGVPSPIDLVERFFSHHVTSPAEVIHRDFA
jgi:hypothetical protein